MNNFFLLLIETVEDKKKNLLLSIIVLIVLGSIISVGIYFCNTYEFKNLKKEINFNEVRIKIDN